MFFFIFFPLDKSTVKSCASEEYLSVGNPLVRNESLSTIPEERTSQMEKSYTIEEPADISFSFDGKEVTVSLYETPDLTHDEALQIIEMYADELSEHISGTSNTVIIRTFVKNNNAVYALSVRTDKTSRT